MKASRQIMDDAPQLRSVIDGRLTYGLQFVEEAELLYGDGTGQHLAGIIPQATAYSAAFTPALPTAIDTLRLASLQATLALYPASGYVLHPTDWGRIELTKDTQGRYIVGDPTGVLGKRLWNLPVVDTQAMQAGKFLTGAFQLGAQIFDRLSIEILISTENMDDFTRNMVTIRGEERLALAVYRPAAFIYGNIP
jgi:HK97 family phage major capsid protein